MKKLCSLFGLLMLAASSQAVALPFNDDMVITEALRTGAIVRGKPDNTVAVGSAAFWVAKEEDTQSWTNPNAKDAYSVGRGKRLYETNCSPCHGNYKEGVRTPGAVAQKSILPAPDITDKFYREKSDGFFYGTIHFGGAAMMPALGWKLSPSEHWDIVSYVREIQAVAVKSGK